MEEKTVQGRQNCCRLCLAPDSECISIFNSYAADKEPLATKINNCVSIKITSNDKLSLRICHACISYLNSWQSFKNRCQASQNKQRNWFDLSKQQQLLDNNVTISAINIDSDIRQEQQQKNDETHDDYTEHRGNISSSILDGITSLKKRKSLTVYPLPAVQIKDEPIDVDEEYNKQHDDTDEIVDPTLFLERTEEEGDEPIMHGSGYDYDNRNPPLAISREASCRACNLKFSTRANARRHERKLHPNLFELSSSTTQKTAITKPTAALAAALELQRVAGNAAGEDTSKLGHSVSTQKYRQEVMNAFNRYETGLFDYDSPEKYQHLLTDEKIVFLQQNEEFLSQYQDMTCRCCQKLYATYKNFMAHMRKKYATLPRNLCFNCLKLNDSKALFISHLKRRNCINLYKVLHSLMTKNANFANAVAATTAAAPEKVRAKELLVNKMYECQLCPQQFRLRLDFRSHVYDDHNDVIKKNITSTQCPFCALDIEDPMERKRHHNNMDCIVNIRCVTCNSKFDSHHKFLDHAYEKHLNGFGETTMQDTSQYSNTDNSISKKYNITGDNSNTNETRRNIQALVGTSSNQKSQYFSRMPQACPICGQQYNNYNNVLRHMESKHPDQLPQTYKCVKCGIGYPRLSNLREHMVSVHAADKSKHTGFEYIVNADAIKITDGSTPNVYTGRYDYVMKDLMSITNGGTIDDDEESVSKKMKMDNSNHAYSNLKECPICNAVFNNNIGLSNHMRSHTAAAQNAAAARNSSSNSLTITPVSNNGKSLNMSATQQAIFKRSLEQAADRRFRRMRCRICQRRFSSKKSYRFHMLNDHQIRNVQFIKCKLCDAEFAYEKGLKVHMFKIHNTLLKDDMIIKQYECDICSIVYRNEDQLIQHKKNVHSNDDACDVNDTLRTEMNSPSGDVSGISTPISGVAGTTGKVDRHSLDNSATVGPLYWYQCKYCPSNFNTNKKLAIHINSHDEFDSNDYSCKDCGNVYSGRKSLWVHRYKKHPQIAEPSECTLCKKIFFDSQMLKNHIPTCNRKPITSTGAMADAAASSTLYKHKTGDDDDDDESRGDMGNVNKLLVAGGMDHDSTGSLKIKLPEVACTICGQRFTDQDLFSKHIQIHELELYTDNPLADMFDTGPADPNQFYLDRVNDNGEYACDLCQKTFTQMTAFKVHRKWHFRGDSKQNQQEIESTVNMNTPRTPISHQHLQGLQAIGLMPNAHLSTKSQKRKRELKCQYCPSTFISNNNLRRHIYELHKDAISNLPKPPQIMVDDNLYCRRCNLKFETKHDWIEHKVADARIVKPFGPFQWGCDLCGAYVSRKEKLINHIHNHMKESVITPVQQEVVEQTIPLKTENHSKLKKENDNSRPQKMMQGRNFVDQTLDDKEEYEEEEVLEEVVDEDGIENDDGDRDGNGDGEGDDDGDGDGEDEMDIGGVEDDDSDDVGEIEGEYEEIDDEYEVTQDPDSNHQYEDVETYEDEDEDEEECEEDVEDTNDDETYDSKEKTPSFSINIIRNSEESSGSEDSPSYTGGDDDDEEEEDVDETAEMDDDEDEGEDDVDTVSSNTNTKTVISPARYPCDLCQVFFESQLDLQKHVKLHFLNGPGSVTLGIKTKSANKSRSSSSDILAVSSS